MQRESGRFSWIYNPSYVLNKHEVKRKPCVDVVLMDVILTNLANLNENGTIPAVLKQLRNEACIQLRDNNQNSN